MQRCSKSTEDSRLIIPRSPLVPSLASAGTCPRRLPASAPSFPLPPHTHARRLLRLIYRRSRLTPDSSLSRPSVQYQSGSRYSGSNGTDTFTVRQPVLGMTMLLVPSSTADRKS